MIDHQIEDDFDSAFVGFLDKTSECLVGSVFFFDLSIIGGVITVIAWGGKDREQPDGGHTEIILGFGFAVVEIIELADQSLKVSDAIAVAVFEAA